MYFIRVLSDSVCFRSFFLRSLVDKLFEFCGQYLTSTIIQKSMRETKYNKPHFSLRNLANRTSKWKNE